MIETNFDGMLLSVTSQTAAIDGDWWQPFAARAGPSSFTFSVSMSVGSGTWVLEGRNSPNDLPSVVATGTAPAAIEVPVFRQYRMRWTAVPSTLTATASLNTTLRSATVDMPGGDVGKFIIAVGSKRLKRFFHYQYGKTLDGSGKVSQWDDCRGPGIGFFTGQGTAKPSVNADGSIQTDGDSYFRTLIASREFDLSTGKTLILWGSVAAGGFTALISDLGVTVYHGINESGGFIAEASSAGTARISTVAAGATPRVVTAVASKPVGTGTVVNPWTNICVSDSSRVQADANGVFTSNANFLSLGARFDGASHVSIQVYAFAVLEGAQTTQDRGAIRDLGVSMGISMAASTPNVLGIGDSLITGFRATVPATDNPLSKLMTAAALATWTSSSSALAGRLLSEVVAMEPYFGGASWEYGRAKDWLILWIGTNDIDINVPAATVITQLKYLCALYKFIGKRIILVTCIDRSTFSGQKLVEQAALNAWILSAATAGYCDFVSDPRTAISALGGADWDADGVHLNTIGYGKVAVQWQGIVVPRA